MKKTPGVYIVEKNAFPNSVVEVATAVPAFVGYTETAARGSTPLHLVPTRLTSLAEFKGWFGGPDVQVFEIKDDAPDSVVPVASYVAKGKRRYLAPTRPVFCLYGVMRAFFENGGGACYVVSVGNYDAEAIDAQALLDGIETLKKEQEPTMLVVPETTRLAEVAPPEAAPKDSSGVVHQAMLAQCSEMQDRVAILDIHRGWEPLDAGPVEVFRGRVGTEGLAYGTTYYPWLAFTIFQSRDFTFEAISPASREAFVEDLKQSLPDAKPQVLDELEQMLAPQFLSEGSTHARLDLAPEPVDVAVTAGEGFAFIDADAIQLLNPMGMMLDGPSYDAAEGTWALTGEGQDYSLRFSPKPSFAGTATLNLMIQRVGDDGVSAPEVRAVRATVPARDVPSLDTALRVICPLYLEVMDAISAAANALPPGGAMAGIYTMVDNTRGVWNAPANVSLAVVSDPLVRIDHAAQEGLNVDAVTGKSVNAIRPFVGEGTLVWGARTLDGNSQDWRYINVRRTMIMLEQSIKLACRAYVFEPNTENTWVTVRSMIENFLTGVWKQGGLAGATPDAAFSVDVGLGSTMTSQDILDGTLRVEVKVAITHPAEFIVLSFMQQMQTS